MRQNDLAYGTTSNLASPQSSLVPRFISGLERRDDPGDEAFVVKAQPPRKPSHQFEKKNWIFIRDPLVVSEYIIHDQLRRRLI